MTKYFVFLVFFCVITLTTANIKICAQCDGTRTCSCSETCPETVCNYYPLDECVQVNKHCSDGKLGYAIIEQLNEITYKGYLSQRNDCTGLRFGFERQCGECDNYLNAYMSCDSPKNEFGILNIYGIWGSIIFSWLTGNYIYNE